MLAAKRVICLFRRRVLPRFFVLAGCSGVFGGGLGRRAGPNQAIITDNCNIFTRSATLPGIKFSQSDICASGLNWREIQV
jgi:hypothetical protein